MYQCFKYRPGL